nr:MAG TPA: hypothetical protein [Caudoviricetes sp.]
MNAAGCTRRASSLSRGSRESTARERKLSARYWDISKDIRRE